MQYKEFDLSRMTPRERIQTIKKLHKDALDIISNTLPPDQVVDMKLACELTSVFLLNMSIAYTRNDYAAFEKMRDDMQKHIDNFKWLHESLFKQINEKLN